jgi:DNA-binding NarL/FixJ family response regulator
MTTTGTDDFVTPGDRLNRMLDIIGFKQGRGRVIELQKTLSENCPSIFGNLKYSTVRSWFQEHTPPMRKLERVVEVLRGQYTMIPDTTLVSIWWKVGGLYPFESNGSEIIENTEALIKVFHADDHEIVRKGVADILRANGMVPIGGARTVEETLKHCHEGNPDVVLLDLNMNGGGIEFIEKVLKAYGDAKILIFSMRENLNIIDASYKSGSLGYVTKSSSSSVLLDGIKKVAKGYRYFMPGLDKTILDHELESEKQFDPLTILSGDEVNVFMMVCDRASYENIAKSIDSNAKAVEAIVGTISRKLGAEVAAFEWIARKYNLLN